MVARVLCRRQAVAAAVLWSLCCCCWWSLRSSCSLESCARQYVDDALFNSDDSLVCVCVCVDIHRVNRKVLMQCSPNVYQARKKEVIVNSSKLNQ